MNSSSMPTVSDIVALLAALERYPVGALLLLLFLLVGVLGIWVYRVRPNRPVRKPTNA